MIKNIIIAILLIAIVVIGIFSFVNKTEVKEPEVNMAGYLTPTVTATNITIGTGTTSIFSAGSNLQMIKIGNLGVGQVYCAFGSDSVLNTGLHLNPVGSSTETSVVISDPNLLGKSMNCIASIAVSSTILKY